MYRPSPELMCLVDIIRDEQTPTEHQVRAAFNPYIGRRLLIDWLIYESEEDDRHDYRYCQLFNEYADPEFLRASLAALKNIPIWVAHVIYEIDWQNVYLYEQKHWEYLDYVIENMDEATPYEMNKRRFGLALITNYQHKV